MSTHVEFHSVQEVKKPANQRIYHAHFDCPEAHKIAGEDRRVGKNGYQLCPACIKAKNEEK